MADPTTRTFETVLVDQPREGVGRITLNRPKALNALSRLVETEVLAAALAFDADPEIGAIIITGSERAFAAGADIAEMAQVAFADIETGGLFTGWDTLAQVGTPLIAAVSGFALGGGAELVMLSDIVVATPTATFGQPEIKLGILPGFGGTQRLTRAVGKAKAMDLCLTGRMMHAEEAERAGLVSRIVEADSLDQEALDIASTIASMSRAAVTVAKAAVGRAFETSLAEGMRYERQAFVSRFASADRTEGMAAFLEKRTPDFAARQRANSAATPAGPIIGVNQ